MNIQGTVQFSSKGKAVMITGCSSGIGRAAAAFLAGQGLTVLATVRKDADAAKLRELGPNLVPINPLDLAKLEDVGRAHETAVRELERRGLEGLYALINNAGGGGPAPIELMDLEEFGLELRARVLGSVAMVQAFLPLLRRAGGRILWIAAPGIMPTPYVASIHACDFAVNCIARTLDIELQRWHIPSVMIRCGGIRTPAGLRTVEDVERCLRNASPDRASLYDKALCSWAKEMAVFDRKRTAPERVAETVWRALSAAKPRRRYSVGHMSKAAALLEALPQPLADAILKMRFGR